MAAQIVTESVKNYLPDAVTGLGQDRQINQMLVANAAYAANFDPKALPQGPAPARHVAIVTCMDARIHVEEVLGLKTGDAHIIRNGGGDAREAVRSLLLSEQLLGTREVVLLKHTDCGFTHFTQSSGETVIKARIGQDVSHMDLKPFSDVDQAVRDDIAFLRGEPLIAGDIKLWGGVFEVETGRVRKVVEA